MPKKPAPKLSEPKEVASKAPIEAKNGASDSPRTPSTDPRAVYMRKYRQDRRSGVQRAPRAVKISVAELEWAREQRNEGRTFRSIATELGVDHSYLARRIKGV